MLHGITDQLETTLQSVPKISILHPCSLVLIALRDIVAKMNVVASIHRSETLASIRDIAHLRQVALVILGESLLEMPVHESIMFVHSLIPNVPIAVLTSNRAGDPSLADLGVSALSLHQPYEAITQAIRDLIGKCGIPDQSEFYRFPNAKSGYDAIKSLSSRQLEILKLLTMGLNNQEIAREQNVSTETIKTHLHDIYQKLEVKNRTQAALLYLSNSG